jgi:hypothetical protein
MNEKKIRVQTATIIIFLPDLQLNMLSQMHLQMDHLTNQ